MAGRLRANFQAAIENFQHYETAERIIKELVHAAGGSVDIRLASIRFVLDQGDAHELKFTVQDHPELMRIELRKRVEN